MELKIVFLFLGKCVKWFKKTLDEGSLLGLEKKNLISKKILDNPRKLRGKVKWYFLKGIQERSNKFTTLTEIAAKIPSRCNRCTINAGVLTTQILAATSSPLRKMKTKKYHEYFPLTIKNKKIKRRKKNPLILIISKKLRNKHKFHLTLDSQISFLFLFLAKHIKCHKEIFPPNKKMENYLKIFYCVWAGFFIYGSDKKLWSSFSSCSGNFQNY